MGFCSGRCLCSVCVGVCVLVFVCVGGVLVSRLFE